MRLGVLVVLLLLLLLQLLLLLLATWQVHINVCYAYIAGWQLQQAKHVYLYKHVGHTFVTFALGHVGHTFVTFALGCLRENVTTVCPSLWRGRVLPPHQQQD